MGKFELYVTFSGGPKEKDSDGEDEKEKKKEKGRKEGTVAPKQEQGTSKHFIDFYKYTSDSKTTSDEQKRSLRVHFDSGWSIGLESYL